LNGSRGAAAVSAAVAAISATFEAAFAPLLLRLCLMAQLGLRPILYLGRDAGLADPAGLGLGADRRNGSGYRQKGQGGGRNQKSAHIASPGNGLKVTGVNQLGSL
jgi:hypothetical protein